MSEIQIFNNSEFGQIRTVQLDNDIYFIGKDVAAALGYADTFGALKKHVADEDKQNCQNDSFDTPRGMTVINESGLYALIFGSKLESAKRFKHWVTSDVLPSIRKHGAYMTEQTIEKALASPDFLIQLATKLKEEQERNKLLQSEKALLEQETVEMSQTITEMQPKVNYVDTILKSKSTVLVTQIAQDYGMSAKAFNKALNRLGVQRYVGGQWILYRKHLDQGYVQSETVKITRRDGSPDTVMNTKWTQKGRLFLYELLKGNGIYPLIEKRGSEVCT